MTYLGDNFSIDLETPQIRVLHVDDDQDLANLAAQFVAREDQRFTVETASSASEGLELIAEEEFDCIVSDYEMPKQDGIEFLESIRAQYPDLPFILFTGKGSEEVASEAISAGVTDYLQKETGTGQYTVLANRIANAVEQYRSERKLEASQERLSLFFDQSPLGVIEWNEEFRIARVNERAEQILGYAADELVGDSWERIVPESDREAVADVVSNLLEAENGYHNINKNVRGNGEQIICEWHNRVVTDDDGKTVAIFSQFWDITERKERERELQQYESYLEGSTDIITVLDEDGTVTYQSPAVERVLGYGPDELVAQKGFDIVHPDDEDRVYDAFTDLVADPEDTVTVECRVETADGEWRWLEIRGRNRLDHTAINGIVTNNRDITERMERAKELEETNTVLRTMVETLPLGILIENSARDVLMANDELCDVLELSYAAEALIGRDCATAAEEIKPLFADPDGFVTGIEERITDREQVHEELDLADGRTVERYYVPFTLPEGDANLWLYRDITDRREREQALTQLQQRTESLMQTTTKEETAQIAVDAAHEVLGAELSGCHLVGDDPALLEPIAFLDAVRQELSEPPIYDRQADSDPPSRVVWDAFERGEPLVIQDTREYTGLAEVTPTRSAVIYPLHEHGVFIVSATAVDAFDDAEIALIEILANALTAAFDRVEREQELRHQVDRLDKFSSVVSHDLRNPLNVAAGRLELAQQECDSDYLDDVADAHDRIEELIDDILTLAREGQQVTKTEPVAIAAVITDCWETVATADATLVVETDQTIHADPSRLRRLLENLFRNAVEHAGPAVSVTVGAVDDGFYVADTGPGIPVDEQDNVFDVGYSTAETGNGFGLNIVQEIADAHGWDTLVTSSDSGGARFEFVGVE